MDDKEYIDEQIEALKEAIDFYSNNRKDERELWVVRTFLENLRIDHTEDELVPVRDDPPDVLFRDFRFEVKELVDEDRRRADEYKEQLEVARRATRIDELLHPYTPRDTSTQEIYDLCLNRIVELRSKYAHDVKGSCDLLIYFNRLHIERIFDDDFPDVVPMKQKGWRSVSFVKGHRGCCFYAEESAPEILQSLQGKLRHMYGE